MATQAAGSVGRPAGVPPPHQLSPQPPTTRARRRLVSGPLGARPPNHLDPRRRARAAPAADREWSSSRVWVWPPPVPDAAARRRPRRAVIARPLTP